MKNSAKVVSIAGAQPEGAAHTPTPAKVPAWIETPTALRVLAVLGFAQEGGDIALIYGSAGTGKSHAAARYAQADSRVWMVTMTPASCAIVPALGEICAATGAGKPNGATALHWALVEHLSGRDGLLIVDEAQCLEPATLDQLRSLHDAAGIGLALIGNSELFTRMAGTTKTAPLDGLLSRIGKRVHFPSASTGDIAAVLDAWGIADPASRAAFAAVGAGACGLRGLTKALRLASRLADAKQRAITAADARAACRELGA